MVYGWIRVRAKNVEEGNQAWVIFLMLFRNLALIEEKPSLTIGLKWTRYTAEHAARTAFVT